MKKIALACLVSLICAVVPGSAGSDSRASTAAAAGPAAAAPPAAAPGGAPGGFVPSQQVSADASISFPVDI